MYTNLHTKILIMKTLKYLLVFILIFNLSCRDRDDGIRDWFQDPPVSPITQTIKTVAPVGYAASLVAKDMKGFKSSNIKYVKEKSSKLLYVDTNTDYPYKFKGDTYGEMIIAYIQTDLNTALVSVFFTEMDIVSGNFELQNIIAFPVVIDDINNKITAVYVSIDINLGLNSEVGLHTVSVREVISE